MEHLYPTELCPETERHPAAALRQDDFTSQVSVLLSGRGSLALAKQIAHRCNVHDELILTLSQAEAFIQKLEEDDDYTEGQVETIGAIRAAIFRAKGEPS